MKEANNNAKARKEKAEELFQKLGDAGFNLFSFAKDKIETIVNDMIDSDTIPSEKGKTIINNFLKETEELKDNFEDKAQKTKAKVMKRLRKSSSRFDFATRKDFKKLNKRVKNLEALVANLEETLKGKTKAKSKKKK